MKISRRQLRKIIQEAMYSARGRRDAAADALGDKINTLIHDQDPESVAMGNELIDAMVGYEPSIEFPDASSYTDEIGQFDLKMKDNAFQHIENGLTPEDKRMRKLIVDNLFSPTGDWTLPVGSLTSTGANLGDFFEMNFMLWSEIIPADYWEQNAENPGFKEQAERVFNSKGGSYYQGDGDTLIPLPGMNRKDQEHFNQVILKVLNNDPQYV